MGHTFVNGAVLDGTSDVVEREGKVMLVGDQCIEGERVDRFC